MTLLREAGGWGLIVALFLLAGAALSLLRRRMGRFRTEALALLRSRHPDIEIVDARLEGGAILRVAGVEVRLDLASLYRHWGGRAGTDAVDRLAGELRAALPPPHPPPIARARPHLLPLIKPMAFVVLYERYPPSLHLVARPFAEDLAIVYAVEGLHQIIYLTEGMRQVWDLPADGVHAIALANLRRKTVHLLEELGGPRTIYEHLDGFEASRILTPDLIAPSGVEPVVAAIPHEHLLLVAPRAEAAGLAERAAAAYKEAKYPLSPAVFQLGEVSLAPLVLS